MSPRSLSYSWYKKVIFRGAWMAQLVKCLTLGFGSGHDLTVREFEPCIGFCVVSAKPAWDSLSPCLSLHLSHLLSLSLSKWINKLKDKGNIFKCEIDFDNTLPLTVVGHVYISAVMHWAWFPIGCHTVFCATPPCTSRWHLMLTGAVRGLVGGYPALQSPLKVLSAISSPCYSGGLGQFTWGFCTPSCKF